ncbi:hypothetical protein Droror1_Dr00027865 [Drosera rotundifolia]
MSSPIQIIDDDDDGDDFDWEAAVEAIDIACQNPPPPRPLPEPVSKKNCRQSTLDGFIRNGGAKARLDRGFGVDEFVGNGKLETRLGNSGEGEERGCGVGIDPETAKTWIYPVNVPFRDYQHAMSKTALFSNTLVCLPTGLGKTLIAAVVMYNYFRWFPEGKIVFACPSRALVKQQIEACHNVVGIPQVWTIDMTGQTTSPSQRAALWKSKRVFFVTPQVLQNDILSGTCMVKFLVCLVIDEAHKATGDFPYCVAVRELMTVPVQLRILALTATPGSDLQTIQHVIDNLHISTLEYRNEHDVDVKKYVPDKKIELIQVPVGQCATDIISLLWDAIHPIVGRLCELGMLQNRNCQTVHISYLLNSRDNFRQAPPPALPHARYGEVEGHFNILIPFYHIIKLLFSHGIRPAYEMVEDNLQKGAFARVMSRNEAFQKAKFLMQQNLSIGAPSPKLSKMLEVLVDHFRKNDPQNSRVIIFTNYRRSVRELLNSLANIGHPVKATQFVGQTSGKSSKGQTTKVQQAVLEEFRKGGYNVIVATSIGEEGLDIIEVDLVICFDANVSPLRMIQRMGRTGRKHKGRVDILTPNALLVLACEGKELKKYIKNKGTGKAMTKLMQRGSKSFQFHPSPRMVPHIYKPELQFLELSIEQFVRHGRKAKDDPTETPLVIKKLTDVEAVTLAKYFHAKENTWEPSLIAFPRFQELPSKVHRVMHSSRTGMLIDAMQFLSGFSYAYGSQTCESEGQDPKSRPVAVDSMQQGSVHMYPIDDHKQPLDVDECGSLNEEYAFPENCAPDSPGKVSDTAPPNKFDLPSKSAPLHSFLSRSGMASLDNNGRVLVALVPCMFLSEITFSKSRSPTNTQLFSFSKQDSCDSQTRLPCYSSNHDCFKSTAEDRCELVADAAIQTTAKSPKIEKSSLAKTDCDDTIVEISVTEGDPYQRSNCDGTPNVMVNKSAVLAPDCGDDTDLELSPRLTNLIKSGRVPESPLGDHYTGDVAGSPDNEKAQTPLVHAPELQTPFSILSKTSSTRDWQMSSDEKSEATGAVRKFKRLRKIGESIKEKSDKDEKEVLAPRRLKLVNKFTDAVPDSNKRHKGEKELFKDVRDLIDEEAEVSSEIEVSEDEQVEEDKDSFEDSFIDDRLNPTAASSLPEDGRVDMMAVYRRSLLSQSPITRLQNSPGIVASETMGSTSRATESRSLHSKSSDSPRTPVILPKSHDVSVGTVSVSSRCNGRIPSDGFPSTSGRTDEQEHGVLSRKRKLTNTCISAPIANLEQEFMLHSAATGDVTHPLEQASTMMDADNDDFASDDQFFQGLDLDELEAQAMKHLKQKAVPSKQDKTPMLPTRDEPHICGSPSFDLGIL